MLLLISKVKGGNIPARHIFGRTYKVTAHLMSNITIRRWLCRRTICYSMPSATPIFVKDALIAAERIVAANRAHPP